MEFVRESGREGGEVCFGRYSWRHGEIVFAKKWSECGWLLSCPSMMIVMMKLS
jgi:hypothetical protein